MSQTKHSKEALGRKDADVVKKGSGPTSPKGHWEMDVSRSVFPRMEEEHPLTYFLPKESSKRPTPHVKINECDH